jgi:hypothetical protein
MDGLLSALPLQFVTNIVETFVVSKRDVSVTSNMISIASNRLTKFSASILALKASLSQLLSLLKDIVQSAEDTDATGVALECIAKLSRVHGKTELSLFENVVPVIAERGVGSGNDITIQNSLNCLLSMLYFPLPAVLTLVPFLVPE